MQMTGNPEQEGITGMKLVWHVYDGVDYNYNLNMDPVKGLEPEQEPVATQIQNSQDDMDNHIMKIEKIQLKSCFESIGVLDNYYFDTTNKRINYFHAKFHLPEPTDSVTMLENCIVIGKIQLKRYNIKDPDYTFRCVSFVKYDILRIRLWLCYK